MSALNMLMSAAGAGGAEDKLYVDDVFSAFLRTGTGADVTVTTGIDMTKGYMLWSKGRSGATDHAVYDSARGVTYDLVTNSTAAQTTQAQGLKSVSSTGHTIGSLAKMNTSGATYADYVFRNAAKFFYVVAYAGNGVGGRVFTHNFGSAVGMVIVKNTSNSENWNVWHRNAPSNLCLNSTSSECSTDATWAGTVRSVTDTTFTLYAGGGGISSVNANGATYVAYLFAHDTSADGIIQCGSFTTDGSGNGTITHNWPEGAQFAMLKCSSTTGDWEMFDTARTSGWSGSDARLRANLTQSEDSVSRLSASSNVLNLTGLSANATYIYKIIRAEA